MTELINFLKNKFNLIPNNVNIYVSAFTHRSFKQKYETGDYEKLEFLGDSIIGFVISSLLYKFNLSVKELSCEKAKIVSKDSLNFISKKYELDKFIRLDSGCQITKSIMEDVYESFIGSIYLDLGIFEAIRVVKETLWISYLDKSLPIHVDYKTEFQNFIQSSIKKPISYDSYKIYPERDLYSFKSVVFVDGEEKGFGLGSSIKEAEQNAARSALINMNPNFRDAVV